MTQSQRQRHIRILLEAKMELLVEEACAELQASPATIRRDFNELVALGHAEKTWGGIMRTSEQFSSNTSMLPLSYRQEQYVAEKKRIAEYAASLVTDNDVIMIDGGTTTFFMAPFVANKSIRVITNSIIIALQIDKDRTSRQGAEVFLTGGMLYPQSGLLVGPLTNDSLKSYHARLAFLSAGAIDQRGPSNSNQLVVESERAMIEQSEKSILLADSSKFFKRNMCAMCTWDQIDTLITDKITGMGDALVQTVVV